MLNKDAFLYNESLFPSLIEVCEPLFKNTPINSFRWGKFFKGGRHILLATDKEWAQHQFSTSEGHGECFKKIIYNLDQKNFYYFPWPSEPGKDFMLNLFYRFNIWHGLSIYKREGDTVRFWCFATNRENSEMNNFYINNKSFLRGFVAYIEEKAGHLLKNPPSQIIAHFKEEFDIGPSPRKDFQPSFQNFYKAFNLSTKDARKHLSHFPELTQKQFECLFYLSQGKTAKETARILNICSRTVEQYIDQIRDKTGYRRKSELINFFFSSYKDF